MQVALVAMETTQFRDTAGARRFERLARNLANRGHDVTFYCAQWWPDRTVEDEEGNEVTEAPLTHEADGVTYRRVTTDPSTIPFYVKLPYVLATASPDVIHVRPSPPQAVVAADTAGLLARAPVAVEWYGDEGLDEESARTKWAATEPDCVVTPSELVRTRVRELGAGDDATRVIPDSIDFDLVEAVDPAAEVDVAFAHSLDESANLESLLLGLAELRDRGWSATIIGDGPARGEYEQQASDLRIDDRVEFVGACGRERRLEIYRGAHAFVQTSYRSEFPRDLLWALACGCVGIVEYQAESSAHELIENYPRSYGVTNPQQIADAIVDAGDYDHLTVDDTWESHDHDAVLEQYLDCYGDLQDEMGLF
ncbi:glycosyltransferase family 4 protein [Halobacteriales archaeon Cl-PHB]